MTPVRDDREDTGLLKFVTKDRLVYILLILVGFLGAGAINDKVGQVNQNTKDISQLQSEYSALNEKLEVLRTNDKALGDKLDYNIVLVKEIRDREINAVLKNKK